MVFNAARRIAIITGAKRGSLGRCGQHKRVSDTAWEEVEGDQLANEIKRKIGYFYIHTR